MRNRDPYSDYCKNWEHRKFTKFPFAEELRHFLDSHFLRTARLFPRVVFRCSAAYYSYVSVVPLTGKWQYVSEKGQSRKSMFLALKNMEELGSRTEDFPYKVAFGAIFPKNSRTGFRLRFRLKVALHGFVEFIRSAP